MGIFARRLHATTCAKESGRALDRASKDIARNFPLVGLSGIPLVSEGGDDDEEDFVGD